VSRGHTETKQEENNMKCTIDKEYTTIGKLPIVKAAVKELKVRYSESDLLNLFTESSGYHISGKVVDCEISAFNTNNWTDNISFMVTMTVYSPWYKIWEISFFMTYSGDFFKVDGSDVLTTVHAFKLEKETN
jgi:hypothetical protein